MSGDILAICRGTHALLNQATQWVDAQGNPHDIDAMSVRYKANVVAFLERRAAVFADRYVYGELMWLSGPWGPSGEMAQESLDEILEDEDTARRADPVGWLRGTPLVARLLADIAAGRGGGDD